MQIDHPPVLETTRAADASFIAIGAPSRMMSYTCPGEEHPIPRSVHLSRLAAFYPKCRDCPHRNETGQLPAQTVERLQNTERRVQRPSLFTDEGVRGIYLNELTRTKASQIAGALASVLWDETPLVGRTDLGMSETGNRRSRPGKPAGLVAGPVRGNSRRPGPVVLVGYDERPSSPDIVTGVITSLKRMGCPVIDIGLTTRPCLLFAVDHLQAAAGVFVTGSGCEPSWTGLDIVGRGAIPFSRGTGLEHVEQRLLSAFSRPTRRAGGHRVFQATIPYEAGLWKHFHALRPLRVCCGSSSRLSGSTLSRIFEKLPCELRLTEMPCRARDVTSKADADVVRMGVAVRQQNAHLGVVIDDDGQRCGFVDERGELVAATVVSRIIAGEMLTEHRQGTVLLDSVHSTMGELARALSEPTAVFGGGAAGRYWFQEAYPACDAILAVAKVLQALSRSDAVFSAVATAHSPVVSGPAPPAVVPDAVYATDAVRACSGLSTPDPPTASPAE